MCTDCAQNSSISEIYPSVFSREWNSSGMELAEIMTADSLVEQLVRKAQECDSDAFAELTSLYQRRVEALVASRMVPALRKKLPVEDAVQETFSRALESIDRFRWCGEDSFMKWLGTIARNVIARAARNNKVSTNFELVREVPGSGTSPSRLARREERFDRLEQALKALTPDQRKVIRLSRIDGLKIRDIAQRLGKTPDAVQQLIVRGLRSLRRNFGDTESFHLPDRELGSDSSGSNDEAGD